MHTTILKKLTPKNMCTIFDGEHVNIRFYKTENFIDQNTAVYFEIYIRHTEEEDPKEIFNNALKIVKNENNS